MYLVGITEEDFIGFKDQMKSNKQLLKDVQYAGSNAKTSYASGNLKNIYMFKDASISDCHAGMTIVEEKAAVSA